MDIRKQACLLIIGGCLALLLSLTLAARQSPVRAVQPAQAVPPTTPPAALFAGGIAWTTPSAAQPATDVQEFKVCLPLVAKDSSGTNWLLNQPCPRDDVSTFSSCTNSYCCQSNNTCTNNTDCQQAAQCFRDNGGMRGYPGISACRTLPGTRSYMENWACQFTFCNQFMSVNEGERCLTQSCREVTAACFSNPDCYALKYCIVDGISNEQGCTALYPDGKIDFDNWRACGQSSGCFQLMP